MTRISIDVVKRGFILTYPVENKMDKHYETVGDPSDHADWKYVKEVFESPRKLQKKVQEVIAELSLVNANAADE
jgi:hypothetical protein